MTSAPYEIGWTVDARRRWRIGTCRNCGHRSPLVTTAGMVQAWAGAHGDECEGVDE